MSEKNSNAVIRRFLRDGFEAIAEQLDKEELQWLQDDYSEVLDELSNLEERADALSKLAYVQLPDPPKDPHREDDEYEPPLGLSQDV